MKIVSQTHIIVLWFGLALENIHVGERAVLGIHRIPLNDWLAESKFGTRNRSNQMPAFTAFRRRHSSFGAPAENEDWRERRGWNLARKVRATVYSADS